MIKKELGGGRIGSGKKMNVEMHNYYRSSHNLGRQFRTSMAPGVLIPFLVELGLNGDTFDIDLDTLIRTHPTVGPVFGSFKVQLDIFEAPIRLYNRQLHNDKLNVGMHMEKVIFPQMRIVGQNITTNAGDPNAQQINQSSLLAYLGVRGLGKRTTTEKNIIERRIQAMPLLMYWEIYKNYYANKQEEIGVVVSGTVEQEIIPKVSQIAITRKDSTVTEYINNFQRPIGNQPGAGAINRLPIRINEGDNVTIIGAGLTTSNILCTLEDATTEDIEEFAGTVNIQVWDDNKNISWTQGSDKTIIIHEETQSYWNWDGINLGTTGGKISLRQFPLSNIDDMRETIFSQPNEVPLTIGPYEDEGDIATWPYLATVGISGEGVNAECNSKTTMAGLGLKTYQSDRFNNWLNTEWIDGAGGITEITSIDTSSGSFTMDALVLARKIWTMLNRTMVSGGSYYDWQESTYGEKVTRRCETPMYCGGMSTEIIFGEVVSSSDSGANGEDQPLGTLAGKGGEVREKNRGGTVRIKVQEPSFIMGLVSITPRIDYSQGNKWWTRLETMNDLHKPELDGIGFQELITDEMAAWDTTIDSGGRVIYKSAGKQPSWIEYMTSQSETYGNFAVPTSEMFMTLNRQYQMGYPDRNIRDLTTYIDPEKYDYIFAVKKLGAQNFWMQIGMDITARRKMSAKIIPNL